MADALANLEVPLMDEIQGFPLARRQLGDGGRRDTKSLLMVKDK
jgi:hypothetical protein